MFLQAIWKAAFEASTVLKSEMKIGVIGAGYVGLTAAACLAEVGHHVFCADNDLAKLEHLSRGEMPVFEPHLGDLIAKNRREGRLEFGLPELAIKNCQALFICVGTPLGDDGEVDLSFVEEVAALIGRTAQGYRAVIQKSTVPVGSCRKLAESLQKSAAEAGRNGSSPHWDVIANPEFLREGSAVHDFLHPDRIVIGAETERARELMREIYAPVINRQFVCPIHREQHAPSPVPVVSSDWTSAELIKHTANSFLAMKISFINMVSDLCEAAGGDVGKVAEGIGLDHRIGPAFLRPGIGFGGSCFPKDVQGFIKAAEKFGCDFSLLKEVEKINASRVDHFVAKVKDALGDLRGKKIGVWGLAFKPNTDDVRNSPALAIVRRLLAEGAQVKAYDPQAMPKARLELPEIEYCEDMYAAAAGAEALLVLTEWEEFRNADWARLRVSMRQPLVFNGRNTLGREGNPDGGPQRTGLGRSAATPAAMLS